MSNLIFWGISILIGIIICWQTTEKRWLKCFLTSAIIILIGKVMLDSGAGSEIKGELNTDRLVALIGQSFGFGLVTGSVGYWIGNAIFKPKGNKELGTDK